ncbi:TlpA disulfide reductase family protein (plasmid) [Pelagibacterium nitratireducens]|jgi:thiol-disulfide isomerase/thioredoxin|uniref:TlpA disulfide reductase family protein n=1 Tax=Pelagibacterium nitratireducens TaxID=1046114 RepID=A0ABZ2IAA0_9HYPH|tara:strand:+ start:707 stop:1366 length:660 start_codon:yes stop_codon:yes gene_type:complete
MEQDKPEENKTRKSSRALVLGTGLFAAMAGIAAAVWISNGPSGSSCPVRAEAAQSIDDVAQGELAALMASTQWRDYSDIAFQDADGNPITLATFAGKKLLINFWATWCAPCREEMPYLDALEESYGGDDFEVVAISLDMGSDGPTAAGLFLEEIGTSYLKLFADPSYKLFERLRNEGVTLGLPATVLVDEKGCELAVIQGPANWDSSDGHRVIETLLEI